MSLLLSLKTRVYWHRLGDNYNPGPLFGPLEHLGEHSKLHAGASDASTPGTAQRPYISFPSVTRQNRHL